MNKRILSLLAALILLLSALNSCSNIRASGFGTVGYVPFYRKVAREVHDDGWVFSFVREGMKDGNDQSIMKYQFTGFNIRYLYAEKLGGISSDEAYRREFLVFGRGSEAEERDMKMINEEILTLDRTDAELLALDPAEYKFEALDGDMFFRLMRQALESEPQEEGRYLSYWDKPQYAFLSEKEYTDGYMFQICFLSETGLVDELYIDVLYKTGEEKHEYDQLSDLVQEGRATAEQKELFDLLLQITKVIKESDCYVTDIDTYKDKNIGGAELSRLYIFLRNIHINHFEPYTNKEPIEPMPIEGVM